MLLIIAQYITCFSNGFPFVGARLFLLSLRCTYFCKLFPLVHVVRLSLQFSSSSAFLRSLFTQSSHLSCGLPRFLQPSCFVVPYRFGNLPSFIMTMLSSRFLATIQALVPTSSLRYFFSLQRLFSLSSCSRTLAVYVVAVRTELTSPSHVY